MKRGRSQLTGRQRGEAEGVESILRLILRPVAANAGQQVSSAGRPRADDGVMNGAVVEPAGVAPVQALRPRCNQETRCLTESRRAGGNHGAGRAVPRYSWPNEAKVASC